MLAAATIVVASLAGAGGWELNSHINNSSTSTAADKQWLIKMVDLAAQFPSGFHLTFADATDVTEQSLPKQEDMTQGATVIPANCANPAERNGGTSPPVGAILDSLTGVSQGRLLQVTALVSPQPIPVQDVPPHCDAVVFYKAGLIQGFTGSVVLPPIPDGVAVKSSQAVRVSSTITDGTGPTIDTVRYVYRALLDDLHTVTVTYTGQINSGPLRDLDPTPANQLFTQALATLHTA
ncbi:DUF5642 family protein [Mycobacterium sp. NPDC050441]|uniref:DUF5642 family protein n=1 Tax=Mycobacterium sp. NPDC050441 TaxID=3155403 RepID=UPI0033E0C0E4